MITALLAALLVLSPHASQADAEERLISWAASDFRAHLPGPARGFRTVHAGKLQHANAEVRPLLCGEVQVEIRAGSTEWMKFATLETSGGYEQWLGRSADTWCSETTKRDLTRDLSERLAREVLR